VNCGSLITEEQKFTLSGRNYCPNCAITARSEKPALNPPSGVLRFICYIVTFFSPFAGFVLGVVFLSQESTQSRNFGRTCVIIMCVSLALMLVFFILALALGGLGASAASSGVNMGEGYY